MTGRSMPWKWQWRLGVLSFVVFLNASPHNLSSSPDVLSPLTAAPKGESKTNDDVCKR